MNIRESWYLVVQSCDLDFEKELYFKGFIDAFYGNCPLDSECNDEVLNKLVSLL